jgi:thiamine pyrophosphokinase
LKTIIFANGTLSDPESARAAIGAGDFIIAADGGARHCQELGITPDLVVGDFDSLEEDELARLAVAGGQLIRYPAHKDETDLELALGEALARGAERVIVFGALGARWDMSLANLLLLSNPVYDRVKIELVDGRQRVLLVSPDRPLTVAGRAGDTLSLIPVGGDAEGVETEGLEYPLKKETLKFGAARGVSNVLVEEQARVSLAAGHLLCVILGKVEHVEPVQKLG